MTEQAAPSKLSPAHPIAASLALRIPRVFPSPRTHTIHAVEEGRWGEHIRRPAVQRGHRPQREEFGVASLFSKKKIIFCPKFRLEPVFSSISSGLSSEPL